MTGKASCEACFASSSGTKSYSPTPLHQRWGLRPRGGLLPQFFLLALLAFAQALRDRGASSDQRGFVGQSLREISVILRYDIECGFPGELAVVLGQEAVHVDKLFVHRPHTFESTT